jgi:hypothetical protein
MAKNLLDFDVVYVSSDDKLDATLDASSLRAQLDEIDTKQYKHLLHRDAWVSTR